MFYSGAVGHLPKSFFAKCQYMSGVHSFKSHHKKSKSREVWTPLNSSDFCPGLAAFRDDAPLTKITRWNRRSVSRNYRWNSETPASSSCRGEETPALQNGKQEHCDSCLQTFAYKKRIIQHSSNPQSELSCGKPTVSRVQILSLVYFCLSFSRPLHESFRPMNGKYKLLEEISESFWKSVL